MKKHLLTLLLTLCATLSLLPATALAAPMEMPTVIWSDGWPLLPAVRTYEGNLSDVSDAWCADAIKTVYEAGLMEGKTATRFDITSSLTNAQIVVIAARLHSLLRGGDGVMPAPAEGEAWYYPALQYLLESERTSNDSDFLLNGMSDRDNDQTLPNQPCTRLDFVTLLDAVLTEEPHPREVLNPTAVPPDTDNESVVKFYQAGILTGSDLYGTFWPSEPLTRGAAAAILARLVAPLQRERFELLRLDLCRDVLGLEPDTVLLTLDGQEVTAEIFAYACVASATLLSVSEKEAWMVSADGPLNYLRSRAAFARVVETLIAEGISYVAFTSEEEAEMEAQAQEKAGRSGISQDGWAWALRQDRFYGKAQMYYMSTYGEGSPRDGESGISMLEKAVSAAQKEVQLKTMPALEAIDWNAVYTRALKTPCAGFYIL